MSALSERWRSYLSARCAADVEALAEAFPDRRSVRVDVVDLHDHDEELVRALFEDPDQVLARGGAALGDAAGVQGPVHLRIENNPHRCSVSAVGARHLHDLVTVEGVVDAVADPGARAATASYDCPACDAEIRRTPSGIEADPPLRCGDCGWDGEFAFRPSRSRFVDLQEVSLRPPPESRGADARRSSLSAFLDDDLIGAVSEGERCCVTGVLRVHRGDHGNQFTPYLDARGVHEERDTSAPDDLEGLLDSYWRAATDDGG